MSIVNYRKKKYIKAFYTSKMPKKNVQNAKTACIQKLHVRFHAEMDYTD